MYMSHTYTHTHTHLSWSSKIEAVELETVYKATDENSWKVAKS